MVPPSWLKGFDFVQKDVSQDDWPTPCVRCICNGHLSGVLGTCSPPKAGLLVLVLDQWETHLALGARQLWVKAVGRGGDCGRCEHTHLSEGGLHCRPGNHCRVWLQAQFKKPALYVFKHCVGLAACPLRVPLGVRPSDSG